MPINPNSILQSTKKILNVPFDYDAFDLDIMTHINSAFMNLTQLGVGPVGGFAIEDDVAEWKDLLGDDPRLNAVKTYVYYKVRMAFDPPPTSFGIAAVEKQIQELEWRLNIIADPAPMVLVPETTKIYDPFE